MIRINSISLKGPKGNYKVNFSSGLNFISGPMATGKSTILEMINYCFGSKSHKDYIEVRRNCTEAILDVNFGEKRILIERSLFDFRVPIKIFEWDEKNEKFSNLFKLFNVLGPKDENSLSNYLLAQLGWPVIKVHGQPLSYRDVFKYCYVSQEQMGTENLLGERSGVQGFKRKPTFEFILEFLNNFTHELKEEKKQREEELNKFHIQKKAILDFLEATNSLRGHEINLKSEKLKSNISFLADKITNLREKGVVNESKSEKLEFEFHNIRKLIIEFQDKIQENINFLSKLKLLRNQYNSELEKVNFIIASHGVLEKVDFIKCPACMAPITDTDDHICYLCGDPLTELSVDEIKAYNGEKLRLSRKATELAEFIEDKVNSEKELKYKLSMLISRKNQISDKLTLSRKNYVSPILEELELLNQEYGELVAELKSLDELRKISDEMNLVSEEVSRKEYELEELKKRIKASESERKEKDILLSELSRIFSYTLKSFEFPKLVNSYIDSKSYLPYVRGIRYNQLGSGGASTLIHLAYMLAITLISSREKLAHPGVLIFDTIGKNLGGSGQLEDVDFKDELILKNIVKTMLDICSKYHNIQIIVTNNGYPANLPSENLVVQFGGDEDGKLQYGLIV